MNLFKKIITVFIIQSTFVFCALGSDGDADEEIVPLHHNKNRIHHSCVINIPTDPNNQFPERPLFEESDSSCCQRAGDFLRLFCNCLDLRKYFQRKED